MISSWFPDTPRDLFEQRHFQRAPMAQPGAAAEAIPFLTWSTIRRLVDVGVDMLVVRNSKLRREENPATFEEAESLFREGHSLVLRHCERHDAPLAALAERFGRELAGDVSIQIYATPANHHSFGWHYDCEDVFIAQTVGTKEYYLRRNTVNPEPVLHAMPRDMHFEREATPILASTLVPGDALYIPRGWWHVAKAREHALSISVGVLSPQAR
jgi:50S ribosomal protein L16 3-hydroxylase